MNKVYCKDCEYRDGRACHDPALKEPIDYECLLHCTKHPPVRCSDGLLLIEPDPGRLIKINLAPLEERNGK